LILIGQESEERWMRMGPFNMPWLTFSAFIVINISIVAAIVWAVMDIMKDPEHGEENGEGRR
jgi:hypothetical protein